MNLLIYNVPSKVELELRDQVLEMEELIYKSIPADLQEHVSELRSTKSLIKFKLGIDQRIKVLDDLKSPFFETYFLGKLYKSGILLKRWMKFGVEAYVPILTSNCVLSLGALCPPKSDSIYYHLEKLTLDENKWTISESKYTEELSDDLWDEIRELTKSNKKSRMASLAELITGSVPKHP